MTEGGHANNIDELLRMRSRLDQELRARYSKEVSILFTDIKGSTSYFEQRGDLEGRAMVQAHNDLLFPIIEKHGGTLIKTIGDAIMASFQVPLDAVETAVDMQAALDGYNRGKAASDRIMVRIGINHGTGLVEKNDVYGDVVNVAARIESLADGGEILVSGSVYEAVRSSDDLIVRYHSTTEVKGKAEPIEVYRVVWREDMGYETVGVGSEALAVRGGPAKDQTVLTLEFSREAGRIKLTASEKSEGREKTLRHYEDKAVSDEDISRLCSDTIGLLRRANNRGRVTKEILVSLKEVGHKLYDILVTPKAKELISATSAGSMVISMDDRLVHIPWEMLYDGEEFLCMRFAMGRLVATRQSVGAVRIRTLQRPLKMLLLSDPKGDLKASYQEGVAIRDELETLSRDVIANLRTGPIEVDYTKGKMRNYDILHYAGHADYDLAEPSNSGWLMSSGKLTAKDIMEMAGGKPMPSLVFSNACHSGQTGEWAVKDSYSNEIFGLANAFLLSGVQHYVGTFWEILDEPSAAFAIRFYFELMSGAPVGEALRRARLHLVRIYGEDNIVWASYMLYGDPTFSYGGAADAAAPQPMSEPEEEPAEYALPAGAPRATAAESLPAAPAADAGRRMSYVAAAVVLVALAAGGAFILRGSPVLRTASEQAAVPAAPAPVEVAAEAVAQTAVQPAPSAAPSGPEGRFREAYALLRAGRTGAARAAFGSMSNSGPEVKGYGYCGLALASIREGDLSGASSICDGREYHGDAAALATVVRGDLRFARGDAKGAAQEYTRAVSSGSSVPLVQALAYNGLGRAFSASGMDSQALDAYTKAEAIDGGLTDASLNKGSLLLKMGEPARARQTLTAASSRNPDDRMAAALAMKAGEEASREAAEHRQRVRELARELVARFKEKGGAPVPDDAGADRPITVSFVDFSAKGAASSREGEDAYLLSAIQDRLIESGKVQVVERELLESVLDELEISSSELADSRVALRVGRILSARFITTGSLFRMNGEYRVSLRVIETETTALKASVSDSGKGDMDVEKVAAALADGLASKLTGGAI